MSGFYLPFPNRLGRKDAMSSSILDNAAEKIAQFNVEGLHYNLVADAIHRVRDEVEDPFNRPFLRYVIAGLVAFDMARLIGAKPYDFRMGGGCLTPQF